MFPIGHTGSARRALSEILFLLVPNTAKRLEKKKDVHAAFAEFGRRVVTCRDLYGLQWERAWAMIRVFQCLYCGNRTVYWVPGCNLSGLSNRCSLIAMHLFHRW